MKRDDIEIGVEYCRTGPLAYGREPLVAPAKVRFLNKSPNYRIVNRYRLVQRKDRLCSEWVGSSITDHWQDYGIDTLAEHLAQRADGKDGDEFILVQRKLAGTLSAEIWRNERWEPIMVAPADIHRTWAEHEDREAGRAAARTERLKVNAPDTIERRYRELYEAFRLLGLTEGDLQLYCELRQTNHTHCEILRRLGISG